MMGVVGLKTFSFIAIASLLVFEEWVSTPACKVVPASTNSPLQDPQSGDAPDDLKVMLVADLLLLGSDSGYVNRFFRDFYMSKFFRKSFESLKPDLLLVLGDVSAKGSELTKGKWTSVLHQFYQVLGPFVGLPFHAVLGDRDIGECNDLDLNKVNWISRKLPGLDSSGCGAFEIGNISFVTLNSVALLCRDNGLRFEVEKVIERESLELRKETEAIIDATSFGDADYNFIWRVPSVSSGSGPVILLHFPLEQTGKEHCGGIDAFKRSSSSLIERSNVVTKGREHAGAGLYKLLHTLPPNASEYILQALKPRIVIWFTGSSLQIVYKITFDYSVLRLKADSGTDRQRTDEIERIRKSFDRPLPIVYRIIFSAHSHEFSDHVHFDQTREVTIPAMSWNARDDPGFVFAKFQKTGREMSISYCSLTRESHILLVYVSIMVLFCLLCFTG